MNLGNAFARRKQIDAEITNWINRIKLSGRDTIQYRTKEIYSDEKLVPIPGSTKTYSRTYTIEECRKKLAELIKEDRELALQISLTNQTAKAKLIDLDGIEKELSIPELLVLKNEIAPKLENAARAVPIQSTGVEVINTGDNFIKWRNINQIDKKEQSVSEKGVVITNQVLDYYQVEEITDYGLPERTVYDEIDKIHIFMKNIKEAINNANQTELVDLK